MLSWPIKSVVWFHRTSHLHDAVSLKINNLHTYDVQKDQKHFYFLINILTNIRVIGFKRRYLTV